MVLTTANLHWTPAQRMQGSGLRMSAAFRFNWLISPQAIFTKRFGGIAMTNATHHANENLTVHLKVKDYATWRTGYDGREKSRVTAGITNGRVFRRAEDPNDVVILQDVADVAKARTWLASDEMKAAMEKGGVVGSPNVRFAAAA
jgi:hypothetical protein